MSERAVGTVRVFTETVAPIELTEDELSEQFEAMVREKFEGTGWAVIWAGVER